MRQLFLPPITFLLAAGFTLKMHYYAPRRILWDWPVNLIGVAFLAVGLAIAFRHAALFRKVGTEINTFRRPGMLVKEGFFQYSRNPMYLGFVLALVGVAVICGSIAAFIPVLGFFLLTHFWYIPFEEDQMRQQFGDQYSEYASNVRRWI